MLVNSQETRYTALLFFNMRKKWSTNYCVELKKKKTSQLKALQNK